MEQMRILLIVAESKDAQEIVKFLRD